MAATRTSAAARERKASDAATSRKSRQIRFSVSAMDTSVIDWIEAQADLSLSMREIIRETIQRHGYGDFAFREVQQLPRRGRPPSGEQSSEQNSDDEDEHSAADVVPPNTFVMSPASQGKRLATPEEVEARSDESAPESEVVMGDGGQVSVDDIMASTRR